jgi:hypothetical protein
MGIEKAGISIVFCFRGCSLFDALACLQPSFPPSPKDCSLDFESLFLIQVILSETPTWHMNPSLRSKSLVSIFCGTSLNSPYASTLHSTDRALL